jgi:peroxiredoxin
VGVRIGEPVPDVKATTATGEEVSLSQLVADGPVVVGSPSSALR